MEVDNANESEKFSLSSSLLISFKESPEVKLFQAGNVMLI